MNKPATPLPGPVRLLAARIRHGRPRVLAARILGALVLAVTTAHSGAGPAPVTGTLAGITTWLVITSRGDIAPRPGR